MLTFVRCRCGTEFCYGCGGFSHRCECDPDEAIDDESDSEDEDDGQFRGMVEC